MPCRAWKPWLWRAASICATRSPRPTTSAAGLAPSRRRRWARWPRRARARSWAGGGMGGLERVPDSERGGLSAVEEKALGALAKAGKSPVVGVLSYGQAPARKGLHFMDAPSGAVENLTG